MGADWKANNSSVNLPLWRRDWEMICARVRGSSGLLKILIKTCDEPLLIRNWIKHHKEICGLSNLIIADNMSTDKQVLDVYKEFSSDAVIFRFEGPHNAFHDPSLFGDLYKAVADSAPYATFIDSDELLVSVIGDQWSTKNVATVLQDSDRSLALPTTWLNNVVGSDIDFVCERDGSSLAEGRAWGKPILPTRMLGRPVIHNSQYDASIFGKTRGLFLLHLKNLFPSQRLEVNRRKLVSRRLLDSGTSFDAISRMRFPEDHVAQRYADEIHQILIEKPSVNARDVVSFFPNGRIEYSGPEVRRVFANALVAVEVDEALALLARIQSALRSELFELAEQLLKKGLDLYPEYKDQFGDFAFRKELMRLLLSLDRWEEARALIFGPGATDGWHHILFARAYDRAGLRKEAAQHWRECLIARPGNIEAETALMSGEASDLPIRMSHDEEGLLVKTLRGARSVLEFGSGGSTLLAARMGINNIISVESDAAWLRKLETQPEMKAIHFTPRHVDIGVTGEWGYPLDRAREKDWHLYYTAVWGELDSIPDVVLIDGRFRVSCALMAVLHCSEETKIAFHDFWDRPNYHLVLCYLKCIERTGTLGIFVKKNVINIAALAKDLAAHALDVR